MRKLELLGCLALNRQLRLRAVAELPGAAHPAAAGRQAEPHRAGAEDCRWQARPVGCLGHHHKRGFGKQSKAGRRPALGGGSSQGAPGEPVQGRPFHHPLPARRPSLQFPSHLPWPRPSENRSNSKPDRNLWRTPRLQADFLGWARPARRSQPRFHGLLGGPLGRRHARDRHSRV